MITNQVPQKTAHQPTGKEEKKKKNTYRQICPFHKKRGYFIQKGSIMKCIVGGTSCYLRAKQQNKL